MDRQSNIYLIGPRGCGKTSVGRVLAERLRRPFVDTDHLLVESVGMDIAQYVDQNGWDAFRDRETETLERAAAFDGMVVGCGGGIVLREGNRQMLGEGFVFYLKIPAEELVRRLEKDPLEAQRPTLTGKPLSQEVREILEQREPFYSEVAHAVLEPADLDAMVDEACRILAEFF